MIGCLCEASDGFRFHPYMGPKEETINYEKEWHNWSNEDILVFDIPKVRGAFAVFDKKEGKFHDAIGGMNKDKSLELMQRLIDPSIVFEDITETILYRG